MSSSASPAARRVVFVTITFNPEPGALRALPLAKRLRDEHGWEVEAITAIPWYPLGRFYEGYRRKAYQVEVMEGIRVHRVWLYPSHDRSAARRILTYASFMISALLFASWRVRRSPVIYQADNLPTTAFVVALLKAFWGARVVQHIGDLWPDTVLASGMISRGFASRVVSAGLHAMMRWVYATNDIVTVITEGFRRTLISRGVPASKIHVLPNWAEEDRLSPVPIDPSVRRDLRLDDRFMVLYAGNMGPLQALHVVLDAAEVLPDVPVQFVLVGDGSTKADLAAETQRRGLSDRVIFVSPRPVSFMPQLNAAADALLVHLRDEPFLRDTVPSKTQVSLMSGRAILMGCRGEAARLVKEADAGICFAPEDGLALADAVRRLVALGPEARASMGARGAAYYERHLSLRAGVAVMDRLFGELLSRGNSVIERAQSAVPAKP